MDHQDKVNTFLEITGNSDVGYAMNILKSNDWDLEKSIQLDTTLNNTENPLLQSSNILSNSSTTDTTSSMDTPVDATQEEQIRKPDAAHSEQLLPTGMMSSYNLMNQFSSIDDQFSENSIFNTTCSPVYLNENKSFREIKDQAKNSNKYLIVSIRSNDVLAGIHLNRDIWCQESVQDIIKDNFCCWQQLNTTNEGQYVCNLYNITTSPYICIIEACTGREIKEIKKITDHNEFITEICEFLDMMSTPLDGDVSQEVSIQEEVATPEEVSIPEIKKDFIEPTTDYCTIRFSFSNNDKPNIHRFSNTDKVSILYEYIEQEFNQSIFDIIQTYPRKSLKDDKMKTLLSMNLDKSTIIVQYK